MKQISEDKIKGCIKQGSYDMRVSEQSGNSDFVGKIHNVTGKRPRSPARQVAPVIRIQIR